jgi:Protein of unknown function (DUF3572)
MKDRRLTPDLAAVLALKALAFLAGSQDALQRFMDLTGAGRDSLGERADEPEFLASVLDFLLTNEELLIQFCDDTSTDVRSVHMARHVLAGGE